MFKMSIDDRYSKIESLICYMDLYLELYNNKDELAILSAFIYNYCFKDHFVYTLSNIDEVIDLLNKKGKYSIIQIINFIFFVFNDDLYRIGLEHFESGQKLSYLFYSILLCEHIKYCLYEELSNTLESSSPRTRLRNDITRHRCLEHMVVSLEIIDRYYINLTENYPHLTKEIEFCDQLLDYYKIYTPLRKYDIEIIVDSVKEFL